MKTIAKNSLKKAPRKTVAEACAPKRGRPTNAERDARLAKEAKAAERAKAKEVTKKAAAKTTAKTKPAAKEKDATNVSTFKIGPFKTAIKRAVKMFDKDTDLAFAVMATYKENRKLLKDALPKHAVNAFEKSLAAKKDEKLLLKAMQAAEKHIVEKDFML